MDMQLARRKQHVSLSSSPQVRPLQNSDLSTAQPNTEQSSDIVFQLQPISPDSSTLTTDPPHKESISSRFSVDFESFFDRFGVIFESRLEIDSEMTEKRLEIDGL